MASQRGVAAAAVARRRPAPAGRQPGRGIGAERISLHLHRKRTEELTPPDAVRLRELLARLIEADVRFVLVGGLAVNAWGYLRATRDVDFVPDPDPENLARLNSLLTDLGGRVDVDGKLLAGTAISTFLRTGDRTLVATELGQVDVLQGLPQVPPFAALDERAKDVDLDGIVIRVCSLEHLIEMKRSSERARDREDLVALEAVQEEDQKGK